jgi:hypothetical protein
MRTEASRSPLAVDVERSRLLARKVGAVNKQCWANAFRGMGMAPIFDLDWPLEYVEGWVAMANLPIATDHAWLVDTEARVIIDPTPIYHEDPGRAYFPAVSYGRAGFARAAVEVGQQPFALKQEPEAWRAAYWAAQVWVIGKEGCLYLHDQHLTEEDREYIDQAEENPDPDARVEVAR